MFKSQLAWLLLFSMSAAAAAQESSSATAQQIAELTALVQKLQTRVSDLEQRLNSQDRSAAPVTAVSSQPGAEAAAAQPAAPPFSTVPAGSGLLKGTTVNFQVDGYYGYNFNSPIGRVNLLRAYDVSSNAFSLNQAGLVLENAPDPAHGKRFGLRLDLQFGQATETLQGSAVNEPRPDVYRNIFQAYGTYVLPVGNGLTVDFGKWSSSLGIEGNYTKDQVNYSRSYWFDFLPFYHAGARVNYKVNDTLSLNYWVVNGTQQTEAFNGFKDELFGFNLQPSKSVALTVNYYLGQEHPDFMYVPGSTLPNLPSQQGTPFVPIPFAPKGKLHIVDAYATWTATPKLWFAGELDYVLERLATNSAPSRTDGGCAYVRYQLSPRMAISGRAEYLSDHGGLFTGATQAIKETTVTLEQKIAEGFLMREEWRRDFSNRPFFLTDTLGILKREQNTATLGLVWWFGGKEGVW